jgi:hypothetical protein
MKWLDRPAIQAHEGAVSLVILRGDGIGPKNLSLHFFFRGAGGAPNGLARGARRIPGASDCKSSSPT